MAIINKITNNYYDEDYDVVVTETQTKLFGFIKLAESVATTNRNDYIKLFQVDKKHKKQRKIGFIIPKKTKKTQK